MISLISFISCFNSKPQLESSLHHNIQILLPNLAPNFAHLQPGHCPLIRFLLTWTTVSTWLTVLHCFTVFLCWTLTALTVVEQRELIILCAVIDWLHLWGPSPMILSQGDRPLVGLPGLVGLGQGPQLHPGQQGRCGGHAAIVPGAVGGGGHHECATGARKAPQGPGP